MADERVGRSRRGGLDTPREVRRRMLPRARVDPESFGRWSEAFARFMGTPRFLVYMTAFVALWLAWNTFADESLQFDPRSLNYTLLTLILSLQASYAAPLILLAQNRQDERDRAQAEQDREVNARTQAEAEFMARELASVRLSLADVATVNELRDAVGELGDALARIEAALDVRPVDDAT